MKYERFLKQIKEGFPSLRWKSHRQITQGWDHLVIVFDERVVFRIPRNKKYRDKLQGEIWLLNYLKKRVKIGMPEYRYVFENRSIAGYDMLNGCELELSIFQRLSTKERELVAKQLAKFLSVLHATPKSIVKRYNFEVVNQEKLYEELVRGARKLVFPRLRKGDIRLIEEYLEELGAVLEHRYSEVLVHNDLTSEHILWDAKKKRVNIIDFSDCALGDPATDFAGILEYGPEFTEQVFKMYSGEKDEQMLKRSRLYFKRVPLWIMIDSLRGFPCTFKEGYEMFKHRFKPGF